MRSETWDLDTFTSGSQVRGIVCLRQHINTDLPELVPNLGSTCETLMVSVPSYMYLNM